MCQQSIAQCLLGSQEEVVLAQMQDCFAQGSYAKSPVNLGNIINIAFRKGWEVSITPVLPTSISEAFSSGLFTVIVLTFADETICLA